jgi:signal transduction histidine kinase
MMPGRHHIDIVINKAVVVGALAVFITAVYVAIVVGIGSLVGARDEPNVGLSIVATVALAVAFQPVRTRVQRFANRLVYGERATPYEVMAGFAHRLAGTLSVEDVLPDMARTAAEGVGATRSRVRLFLPDGSERSVTWPAEPPGEGTELHFDRVLRVSHGGTAVGEIAVSKRGEQLTPSEERLLADLASQAGLALHNVQLATELGSRLHDISRTAEELAASRQRIVAAQDAERRRLERDIRASAEEQLEALVDKLDRVEGLMPERPTEAGALLEELGTDAGRALDALRDLARGIYPPLLADQGPAAALRAHVRKARVPAELAVDPSVDGRRFDPKVEAALYFCCLEALDNSARHAPGSAVRVTLDLDDEWVRFTVADSGTGFDPQTVAQSSGLERMLDRAEALGGSLDVRSHPGTGTVVTGRLPVGRQPAAVAAAQASSSRSGPNADLGM